MKAKDIPCKDCGWVGKIFGSDWQNAEGPWGVQCTGCGRETVVWAYQREAWEQWRYDNEAREGE